MISICVAENDYINIRRLILARKDGKIKNLDVSFLSYFRLVKT